MSYEMYVPVRIMFGAGKLKELQKQSMPGEWL